MVNNYQKTLMKKDVGPGFEVLLFFSILIRILGIQILLL
jgi:hypothetical protein